MVVVGWAGGSGEGARWCEEKNEGDESHFGNATSFKGLCVRVRSAWEDGGKLARSIEVLELEGM